MAAGGGGPAAAEDAAVVADGVPAARVGFGAGGDAADGPARAVAGRPGFPRVAEVDIQRAGGDGRPAGGVAAADRYRGRGQAAAVHAHLRLVPGGLEPGGGGSGVAADDDGVGG
ncbi:hypothetical protein FNX44_023555 [Streptomyces sp. OF1]|uniref:Uncharacterized protein n=1 Tax=Streptomyces alkaliterrae TaxID=2213162 RepID=A0A5P0Z039_9ACTN|nr:hypothetical protein [Streptomyces alkaliterrae]